MCIASDRLASARDPVKGAEPRALSLGSDADSCAVDLGASQKAVR